MRELKPALRSAGLGVTDEVIRNFRVADVDGDGSLSFAEFCALAHTLPPLGAAGVDGARGAPDGADALPSGTALAAAFLQHEDALAPGHVHARSLPAAMRAAGVRADSPSARLLLAQLRASSIDFAAFDKLAQQLIVRARASPPGAAPRAPRARALGHTGVGLAPPLRTACRSMLRRPHKRMRRPPRPRRARRAQRRAARAGRTAQRAPRLPHLTATATATFRPRSCAVRARRVHAASRRRSHIAAHRPRARAPRRPSRSRAARVGRGRERLAVARLDPRGRSELGRPAERGRIRAARAPPAGRAPAHACRNAIIVWSAHRCAHAHAGRRARRTRRQWLLGAHAVRGQCAQRCCCAPFDRPRARHG